VHTHLIVDRARLTATLLHDGRKVFSAPVGVGKPESPTPSGEFYVRNRLSGFGNPFYGPVAFGTSARSAVLTDWPDGGFVGIHGTNEPGLIPGRISHGCVRLRNPDIVRLSRLMPPGTPVTIR
jgi:lipoprotein-anchoring transpeptidase ErfK/SrfK